MNKFISFKSTISNSPIINYNGNNIQDDTSFRSKYLYNESYQYMIKQGEKMKKRADFSYRAINVSDIAQILLSNINILKVDNKSLMLLVIKKNVLKITTMILISKSFVLNRKFL